MRVRKSLTDSIRSAFVAGMKIISRILFSYFSNIFFSNSKVCLIEDHDAVYI